MLEIVKKIFETDSLPNPSEEHYCGITMATALIFWLVVNGVLMLQFFPGAWEGGSGAH